MTKIYDTIIIGAGPGGLTAAIYTSRANLSTLILDRGVPGGQLQNTEEIENFPGFSHISGPDLAQNMHQHSLKFGAEYKYGDVKSIKQSQHSFNPFYIVETSLDTYEAYSVIIATGTKYKKLGVPGEEEFSGRGVSWCAVCDGAFFKNKHVVVVGGGDSAVEEAAYLTKFASKVTLLVRGDKFRAQPILVDRLLKNEKVEVKFNTTVEKIVGEGKVTGVVAKNPLLSSVYDGIKSAYLLECDGVFEYIGMDPVSDFAKDLEITDQDGWIVTNSRMETSLDGIYAIGDIRQDAIRQVVVATGDGCTAGIMARHYIDELKG